ncbi:lipoyl(octanoyl) transferase LipB, partial [Arthrospira platensis SPKY1]|nr:lipoyl(octanoyl) transferase LipB [Arthrospira platensis SPKY1]
MNKSIYYTNLGHHDYRKTWDLQEVLFQKVLTEKVENRKRETQLPTPNFFLMVEHPPVFTLGKSGLLEHLLLTEEECAKRGIDFFKINRGGDITFHGPGQIVGYPILDLENFFTDIHKYLRFLEEMVILTLAEFGLKSERSPG